MTRLGDALLVLFLVFFFFLLFKVRLSKLQKTKKNKKQKLHVAGPAAKLLVGNKQKNDRKVAEQEVGKTSTLWVPPECLALCLTDGWWKESKPSGFGIRLALALV